MMRVAADLADQGLVERVRNPDDRRSYALTRTPEGAIAARTWRRYAEELEDSITAGLTPRQRDDLRALLLRVVEPDLAPDTPEALRDSIGFLITRLHLRMRRRLHRRPWSRSASSRRTSASSPRWRRPGRSRSRSWPASSPSAARTWCSSWTSSSSAAWSSAAAWRPTGARRCCTSCRAPRSGSRRFLMPIVTWPDLLDGCSDALLRRHQAKSTFTFTTLDEGIIRELESLVARAFERYVGAG